MPFLKNRRQPEPAPERTPAPDSEDESGSSTASSTLDSLSRPTSQDNNQRFLRTKMGLREGIVTWGICQLAAIYASILANCIINLCSNFGMPIVIALTCSFSILYILVYMMVVGARLRSTTILLIYLIFSFTIFTGALCGLIYGICVFFNFFVFMYSFVSFGIIALHFAMNYGVIQYYRKLKNPDTPSQT